MTKLQYNCFNVALTLKHVFIDFHSFTDFLLNCCTLHESFLYLDQLHLHEAWSSLIKLFSFYVHVHDCNVYSQGCMVARTCKMITALHAALVFLFARKKVKNGWKKSYKVKNDLCFDRKYTSILSAVRITI